MPENDRTSLLRLLTVFVCVALSLWCLVLLSGESLGAAFTGTFAPMVALFLAFGAGWISVRLSRRRK